MVAYAAKSSKLSGRLRADSAKRNLHHRVYGPHEGLCRLRAFACKFRYPTSLRRFNLRFARRSSPIYLVTLVTNLNLMHAAKTEAYQAKSDARAPFESDVFRVILDHHFHQNQVPPEVLR